MTYAFTAKGTPKGQPRARAFAFNGKARMYDPGTAEGWKQVVAVAGDKVKPKKPITAAVILNLTFYFPRPQRLLKKSSPEGSVPFVSKPDSDNLAKAVMDAMTAVGWWADDALVTGLLVFKFYGAIGREAGVDVQVTECGEDTQ